jgi:hypothetical protein
MTALALSLRLQRLFRKPRRGQHPRRPALEPLEDRTLPSFNSVLDYPVGLQPHGIALGDFNGDGKLDVVTANLTSNPSTISVLLGNGNGTLQPAINYTVGASLEDVKVSDFNNDGILDLAAASVGNNSVAILLGNGNGTFQAAVNYNAGTNPYRLALGDFNGDGKTDIAVADQGKYGAKGGVTILLGNGNGTFQTGASYTTGVNTQGIAVADFNCDGKQDLVVSATGSQHAGVGNQVSILLGNGNGTFQAPTNFTYSPSASPDGVVVADFNGDGKEDLAIANYYANTVSVLLGNGNGTFGNPTNYVLGNSPFPLYTGNLTATDLIGNGKQDLVAVDALDASVWILMGNSNGTFQTPINYPTGGGTQSVAVGDFNGDGKLDLATANIGADSVTVLLGNGNGTFPKLPTLATGLVDSGIVSYDLNGDGKLDLVTANFSSNTVSVLLGNGNGTFQPALNFATGTGPNAVAVGDFNGDGKPDLVTANYTSHTVSVLLGNGDGTFQAPLNDAIDGVGQMVAVGDFNGDGKLDLVTSNSSTNSVSVLLGNGNGTFLAAVNYGVGTFPTGIAVADLAGNGKLDLVVANNKSNDLSILMGNGNGTFQAAVSLATSTSPNFVVVADFNGDGKQDLAVADQGDFGTNAGAGMSIFLGNGNGTFQTGQLYPAGRQPSAIGLGDFNADGRLDLAVADLHGGDVSILLANGNGSFQAPVDYVAGAFPSAIAVGDYDSDLTQDLAFANGTANVVSILFGLPAATQFQIAAPATTTAGSPFTITVSAVSATGSVDLTYGGTVHFSSTDVQAGLPANYTFTSADQGVHTFTNAVTLKSAGNQTITLTDTVFSNITGTSVLNVAAAPASLFSLTGPFGSKAGKPITITVTAFDPYGNVASTYLGTVHFSSTDSKAKLPADYTFTASDAGVHTFTRGFTLKTSGVQFITGADTVTSTITGQVKIHVKAAGASHYSLTGPSTIAAGVAFQLTVTALDAFGNVAISYRGTVHFSSTDSSAIFPGDYQFTGSD